jgi:hypothetical protein
LFRSEIFFRTTQELEFFFSPDLNIRLYDKNSESDFFFPPPKSEYFFQQQWESEYFFRKKNIPPPLPFQVKWSFPKIISLTNIRPKIIFVHSSQCRLIPYLHQRPIFFKANSIHSSIVAILELIRGAQCLIEVIRSYGEEM